MKKKITMVQMRSQECIGESHGGLKTEECPYLPNSIQPILQILPIRTDILG